MRFNSHINLMMYGSIYWKQTKMLRFLLSLIMICLFSSSVRADTIYVLGKSIPQHMTTKPDSMFPSILREAAKRAGHEIKLEIYPGKRALSMFNAGIGDVLAPVQLELMSPGPFKVQVIGSEPVLNTPRFIFSRAYTKLYHTLEDLRGIRLGLVSGFKYGDHIDGNPNLNVHMANNVPTLLKMLNSGRIEALIAFPHSIRRIKNLHPNEIPIYDKNSPIAPNHIAFAFRDTPRGNSLRDSLSAAMVSMKEDGTMARLAAPMIGEEKKQVIRKPPAF